jgi:hypothetical protein
MIEFNLQGGRGGVISGKFDERYAHMEWEMLVGEANLVLYSDSGYWAGKEKIKLSETEKSDFLNAFDTWAKKKKFIYEVD